MPPKRRSLLVIPSETDLSYSERKSDIAKRWNHGRAWMRKVGACVRSFGLELLDKGLHLSFGVSWWDIATLHLRDQLLFLLARANVELRHKRSEGHAFNVVVEQAVDAWVLFAWLDRIVGMFPNQLGELDIGLGLAENLFGKSFSFGLVSRGLGGRISE